MAGSQTKLRADGLSDIESVYWDSNRPINDTGSSLYALIPAPMAENLGLDGDSVVKPGYTPAGHMVAVEEEAIILRVPDQ